MNECKHTSSSPVTDLIPVFMSARGDEWVICKQAKPRRRRRPTDAASRRRRRRDIGSNRRVTGRRVGEIYRRSLSCTCKQAFCRREVKAKVPQPMAALLNQSRSHSWWWWSVRFVDGITLSLTRDSEISSRRELEMTSVWGYSFVGSVKSLLGGKIVESFASKL